MKKEKQKKPSFLEDLKLSIRALKIFYQLDKRFFWMEIVNASGDVIRYYANSILAAMIIDGVANGYPAKTLILYAFLVVGVNLILNVAVQFTAARRYIRKSMWPKFITRFFSRYSEKMDYWRFEDTETREKWNRIQKQIRNWDGIGNSYSMLHSMTHAFFGVGTALAIVVTCFLAKPETPQTGIIGFICSPWMLLVFALIVVITLFIQTKIQAGNSKIAQLSNQYWGHDRKRRNAMMSYETDNKRAMDRKIYGLDSVVDAEDAVSNDSMLKMAKQTYPIWFACSASNHLLTFFISFFSYAVVSIKVLCGALGIGSVVLYVSTLMHFSSEARQFGYAVGDIRVNRIALLDQFSYIDMKRDMYEGTLSVEKRSDRNYQVEFRNVSFRYPGTEAWALRHVNIKFKIGEKLAIVGMNGSGKTTFIKLMCRLYDPTEGEILLNGIDIRKYQYDEYMEIFSIVFQDFKLFAFPLAENVATSKEYDVGRVIQCLEEVGFGDRLESLPKGIETCLYRSYDTDGVEISGGEAQKIALARALYKNAPFIILDEPTAALDPIAEAEIYAKFNDIVGDKTAIYISHRLSSCRFCDKIAVFDNGQIIQVGSHEELLADENGKYHELWHAQAQYYTTEQTS